jgi:hypothetical protein
LFPYLTFQLFIHKEDLIRKRYKKTPSIAWTSKTNQVKIYMELKNVTISIIPYLVNSYALLEDAIRIFAFIDHINKHL